MAELRGEKVTEQTADEKGLLTYCKLYFYSDRICTIERAIASMHFA